MKITKRMKEYIENELRKTEEKILEAETNHLVERKKAARKAIQEYLKNECYPKVEQILKDYNMDLTLCEWSVMKSVCPHILPYYDNRVKNSEDEKTIDDRRLKLCRQTQELLNNFYLECDLGIENKEAFFKALEDMKNKLK